MTDARNEYPRLCWGCLAVIPDYESDYANLNYGGRCYPCAESGADDMPYLRQTLQGYTERMNNVGEREELLQAVQRKSSHD